VRALVVRRADEMELIKISEPKIGPYEALVRIKGCGICSTTDWELIHGRQPYHKDYPAVLGHEAVGEIIETGKRVESFKKGDLVTRPTAIWPGERRDDLASAWGGFAEYGFVRDRIALARAGDSSLENDYTALRQVVLPNSLALPDAILAISLSETASWFRHLPNVAGKTVCISGTGGAGLSLILWSFLAGAEKIFVLGRRKERLQLAQQLGATKGININEGAVGQQLRDVNEGKGADFFLEAVGLPDQIQVGLSILKPGGTIAIYGVTENLRYDLAGWSANPGAATILTPLAEEHRALAWVTRLIERGVLPTGQIMSHSWPLDRYREAFDEVADGSVVKGWIQIEKITNPMGTS
jgi:threonine dehydrogenase-like Zn-dependent dehydrogenase